MRILLRSEIDCHQQSMNNDDNPNFAIVHRSGEEGKNDHSRTFTKTQSTIIYNATPSKLCKQLCIKMYNKFTDCEEVKRKKNPNFRTRLPEESSQSKRQTDE